MSISKSTYEKILKEYNDRRLENARLTEEKRARIHRMVPGLEAVEEELSGARVEQAISRLKGEKPSGQEAGLLKAKKAQLLEAAGFTEKDLEPVYTCPVCKDNGILDDGSLCGCFKKRIIELLYDDSNIRNLLELENFDTFTFKYYSDKVDPKEGRSSLDSAKDAFIKAQNFVKNFESSADNLFISGGTGLGKSFLSHCIAREVIEAGRSVVYISAVRFFELLAEGTFGGGAGRASEIREYLYGCDLLILDDLGTELTNSFVQTSLFDCINERILAGRHTIISANLSLEKLKTNYSERIFSRILSNYILIDFIGDDIRMKKKLEV